MSLINVIAELERCGLDIVPLNEDQVRVKCPFHADDSPSCSVHLRKAVFKCHASNCGTTGDILTLLARVLSTSRAIVYADLSQRYGLEKVKIVQPEVVETAHSEIWNQAHLLKELYLRGVTDDDIRQYRLGAAKGRITIPIKNAAGSYVNIRRYLPGAPGAEKMRNTYGRSQLRLFPIEQLSYDHIVVCGGEIKAVVAARVLNPHNIGAVCVTGGEGSWDTEFTPLFKDKRVTVILDIDDAGVKATAKLASAIYTITPKVYIGSLPLDKDKYPSGDINDFIGQENGDLLSVVESATEYELPKSKAVSFKPREGLDSVIDVPFTSAFKSKNVGQRMRLSAMIGAAAETSYSVPKQIRPFCNKDQKCCLSCPVYTLNENENSFELPPESPHIMSMFSVSKQALEISMKEAIGIPRACMSVSVAAEDHYDVENICISPATDITNRDTSRSMQPAILVGCTAELNSSYVLTGRMFPHPKSQLSTLLISEQKAKHDALDEYEPKNLDLLRVFRPRDLTVDGIKAKLDEIYEDLEANVTHIYMRRDIHLFVDLAYHSTLLMSIGGKIVKSWVEVLILGDNGQGKSEVAAHLQKHYALGEIVDSKNTSVPGLIGGLQQLGNEWYVSWGALPANDKRLAILEELKGAPVSVIAHLTHARSSGIAELVKVKKRRTSCRVRLVAISNPREDRHIDSFGFGVEAIPPLIGAPEDIRRFDAALIVSSKEIDAAALSRIVRSPPKVPHTYDSELSRDLILWAWTRKHDQVIITPEALETASDLSVKLSKTFVETIPLIDRGTTRNRLLRLAISIACRTFSTDDTMTKVIVHPCHVEFVYDLLMRVYSSRVFGYAAYSRAAQITDTLVNPDVLRIYIQGLTFPEEVRSNLIYTDSIDIIDIQDWLGTADRQEAQMFLSLLVRCRAVKRAGRNYKKTPDFIEWLKYVQFESRPRSDADESSPEDRF